MDYDNNSISSVSRVCAREAGLNCTRGAVVGAVPTNGYYWLPSLVAYTGHRTDQLNISVTSIVCDMRCVVDWISTRCCANIGRRDLHSLQYTRAAGETKPGIQIHTRYEQYTTLRSMCRYLCAVYLTATTTALSRCRRFTCNFRPSAGVLPEQR